jgi:hypothetical protein
MIAHLICEPNEKYERRDKQGNRQSMPHEKSDFRSEVVPRAPYGAQTNEAECNERSGSWPTVRTEGSAKTNPEEIPEHPRGALRRLRHHSAQATSDCTYEGRETSPTDQRSPTSSSWFDHLMRHKISACWRGRVWLQVECGSHRKRERGAASGSLHRLVRCWRHQKLAPTSLAGNLIGTWTSRTAPGT